MLADEPEVRGHVAGVVVEHPASPLAWAELADLADSESRALDAFAYAVVAVDLAREQLASSGWTTAASSRLPTPARVPATSFACRG